MHSLEGWKAAAARVVQRLVVVVDDGVGSEALPPPPPTRDDDSRGFGDHLRSSERLRHLLWMSRQSGLHLDERVSWLVNL